MKRILFIIGLFISVAISAQDSLLNVGSGILGGASKKEMITGINTNTTNISTHSDRIDSLQTGVYIAENYGVVGDSVTDDTNALQDAVDAAQDGVLILPPGKIRLTDSILIENCPKIIGSSRTTNRNTGTTIYLSRNKPGLIFYADNGSGEYGYEYGPELEGVYITGETDSSSQDAIKANGALDIEIKSCHIRNVGGHGILIGDQFNTNKVYIKNTKISYNGKSGVYGRITTNDINHVVIENCEINGNGWHGVDVWADASLRIINNTLEDNDSCGINIACYETTTGIIMRSATVSGNYFESNGGGSMYIRAQDAAGSDDHLIYNLVVSENYSSENSTDVTKPDQTANFTLVQSGSEDGYIRDFRFRNNYIASTGLYNFDANDCLKNDAVIDIENRDHDEYVNLGKASTRIGGQTNSGVYHIAGPTAANGIEEDDLLGKIRIYITSPIDITANPQIVDGFDGEELTIIGYNSTNYLRLDDGNGLALDGDSTCTLGAGDMIQLMYIENLDLWQETWRSMNSSIH